MTESYAPSQSDAQTAQFGDVYVIAASGELVRGGEDPLRAELDRVDRLGAKTVVVDLLGVLCIDSSALSILVTAAKRVERAEGKLVLVADDPRTIRVLNGTGLDRVFVLERTLSAAIDAAIAFDRERSA